MLDRCFASTPNERKGIPKGTSLTSAPSGSGFEDRAFAFLFKHRNALGISKLYRCNAARMDGYLVTDTGETILLEMKECLGFGSFLAGASQLMAGRTLLKLKATRAILVFERISEEWDSIAPHGGWGQLALHSAELANILQIGGLQIIDQQTMCVPGPTGIKRVVLPCRSMALAE